MIRSYPLVLAIVVAACGSSTGPVEPDGRGAIPLLITNAGFDAARRDPIQISTARVAADSVFVGVQYGGGCRDHAFVFVASSAFAESNPVQAFAELVHDANGDLCKALVTRDLKAPLLALRDAYRASYRTEHGTISIRLTGFAGALLYTF